MDVGEQVCRAGDENPYNADSPMILLDYDPNGNI